MSYKTLNNISCEDGFTWTSKSFFIDGKEISQIKGRAKEDGQSHS